MNTFTITKWIVVGAAVVLLIWDGFMIANRTEGDTISEIIWRATEKHPLIPFLWGLLTGHFFWRN